MSNVAFNDQEIGWVDQADVDVSGRLGEMATDDCGLARPETQTCLQVIRELPLGARHESSLSILWSRKGILLSCETTYRGCLESLFKGESQK